MHDLVFGATCIAAVGAGLIAGAFFAFSTFVMRALARIPPAAGIETMQMINIVVINPWFMAALMGTAGLSLVLAVVAALNLDQPYAAWLLAGSVLYIIGVIVVTMAFNVPRNNALAEAQPDSSSGREIWARYVPEWTRWNTVRTIASAAAAAAFAGALLAA